VAAGEVVGLLGRNGAGKTTLIRIAMGIIEAQSGQVRVLGCDPRRDAVAVKQRIGYVSEDQILPSFMTVSQIMDLHAGLFPTWDDGMARSLVDRFQLPPRKKIRDLSKGQARQVALLCAVAHQPELLILDEPAGGLDPSARREFLETSINLLNEAGSTILFSSHYMSDVERMAGRIVMLHHGRVLLDRDLDSLREEHCLAMVPGPPAATAERLTALPACIGTRRRDQATHAVFRLPPAACRDLLQRELGLENIPCTTIGLEEMFIELAGGNS